MHWNQVFEIDNNTTEIPGADNWYESDWLGTFYDASVDSSTWFYHTEEKLGWLWITRDSDESGNYWFYHSTHGWLWTGPEYLWMEMTTNPSSIPILKVPGFTFTLRKDSMIMNWVHIWSKSVTALSNIHFNTS